MAKKAQQYQVFLDGFHRTWSYHDGQCVKQQSRLSEMLASHNEIMNRLDKIERNLAEHNKQILGIV